MIKGIHHISMKCDSAADFQNAKDFYINVLGLTVRREWREGIMLDTGSGLIEIFCSGIGSREIGAIRHFALLTDQPDEMIERIRAAGFEIMIEPNNRTIPAEPPYPIRMAFCIGPLGEEIELFQEL